MTTTNTTYWLIYRDGREISTCDPSVLSMTDDKLSALGIASIDRYSPTIDDYVEVRRIP